MIRSWDQPDLGLAYAPRTLTRAVLISLVAFSVVLSTAYAQGADRACDRSVASASSRGVAIYCVPQR